MTRSHMKYPARCHHPKRVRFIRHLAWRSFRSRVRGLIRKYLEGNEEVEILLTAEPAPIEVKADVMLDVVTKFSGRARPKPEKPYERHSYEWYCQK